MTRVEQALRFQSYHEYDDTSAVKRTNPLTDVLKGGSGSVEGSVPTVKRQRSSVSGSANKSVKPGDIKLAGDREAIQWPVESTFIILSVRSARCAAST